MEKHFFSPIYVNGIKIALYNYNGEQRAAIAVTERGFSHQLLVLEERGE